MKSITSMIVEYINPEHGDDSTSFAERLAVRVYLVLGVLILLFYGPWAKAGEIVSFTLQRF